jgi:hypothetical protein
MPKRFCICTGCAGCTPAGCGKLFDRDATRTQRCPRCQPAATRARQARPSSSSRGLGWAHSRRKQADAAYQAAATCQCRGCPQHRGTCGEPFTAANPRTAGHVVPRSRGGGDGPIMAVCRRCNSSDGGRLAHEQ